MYKKKDIEFLIKRNDDKPINQPANLISEYIEGKRILPPNTPFPGFWQNSKTPYSVEIMDNMSPASPIQHQAIMKGAQEGLTAAAENVMSYWMDEYPAEQLFISATEGLIEKWATKRLDPLIDSCGFRHKIFAQTENKKSRRTGDKIFTKEYIGGTLDMASAQSAASLRSDSKRILIRDEIDGAPALLKTGEGNYLDVSFARTKAYGDRKKIMDFSTPGTFENSLISPLVELGDKRKFFIPCPLCKRYQILEMGTEKTVHGLKPEYRAGELQFVYYICDFCHDAFFNHHKSIFLNRGKWRPTSKSQSKTFRSYMLNSLYSPIGMFSWEEVWKEYERAKDNPDAMRAFVNLVLGLPFKEMGSRPDLKKVLQLIGAYRQGSVPEGVLYLTVGIDVQAGSKTNEKNPPRLEIEIVGHGIGFRTWSILYKVIEGDVDIAFQGAWEELNKWAKETGLIFKRSDGREFPVSLIFIDSGDGNLVDVIYSFTSSWQNTFPSKGFSALKKRRDEKIDEAGPMNFKRYRTIKVGYGSDIILYEMSTNYYKTHIYNNLKIERQPIDPQRPGFCDFPVDYHERYFEMLTAEEKRTNGSFYAGGRRNEALDCRVMAMCAGDVYLDAKVLEFKSAAKESGASPVDIQIINHKYVLEMMKRKTAKNIV